MNFAVNELIQSIAGKPSLGECTLHELQQLTTQYPYFAPAQFLLAKKLKEENSSLVKEQSEKASLYFHNPVWFVAVLNEPVTSRITSPFQGEKFSSSNTAEAETPVTFEEVVDQTQSKQEEFPQSGNQADKEQIEPSVEIPIPQFKFQPIDPSKSGLTFEPYHTIDYFASQGIQPQDEEKPKDKLSLQLKSFTEWLKVMKRLPVSEVTAAVSEVEEKKVEKMAEISINDREVVTETMAEVWEKQGNHAKAKETYEKLSLLDPGKSSYFAAKIEQLKNL